MPYWKMVCNIFLPAFFPVRASLDEAWMKLRTSVKGPLELHSVQGYVQRGN